MRRFLGSVLVVVLAACAHVPPEAVRLNQMVNAGLVDMRQKHVALVDALFASKQAELDSWFFATYMPAYTANYETEWKKARPNEPLDFTKAAHRNQYVQDVVAEYDELASKLRSERSNFVVAVEASYGDLTKANAAVTDLVKSAAAVSEAQKQAWNASIGQKFPQLQAEKLDKLLTQLQTDAIKALGGK